MKAVLMEPLVTRMREEIRKATLDNKEVEYFIITPEERELLSSGGHLKYYGLVGSKLSIEFSDPDSYMVVVDPYRFDGISLFVVSERYIQ